MPPFTVPVTLTARTAGARDDDGNVTYSTGTTTVQGVYAPGGSVESTNADDQVVTQPTVYLPSPAPAVIDKVSVLGLDFEVDGDPQAWPANPFTGWVPDLPVVVRLKRVSG